MVGTLHQALVAWHRHVQRPRRPAVAPAPVLALPLALGLRPGLMDGVVTPVALRLVGAACLGAPAAAASPRPAVGLRPVAAGAGADPRPACAT